MGIFDDSFSIELTSPIDEESWKVIADVEFDNTEHVYFTTPSGKQVDFIKADVLEKIRTEIDKARFVDKETRICKNANSSGLEVAMEIIDKYKTESENKND